MTLEDWNRYTLQTDLILSEKDSNQYTLGISILNPTYPRQEDLLKVNRILEGKSVTPFSIFIKKIRNYILSVKHYLKLLALPSFVSWLDLLPRKADVLILSHITNINQLSSPNDPYFGLLTSHLSLEGHKVVVGLIPHCDVSFKEVIRASKRDNVSYIILPLRASYLDSRAIKKALLFEHQRLLHISNNMGNLLRFAAIEVLGLRSFWNQILTHQVTQIVSKLGIKFVITTYEGHAWERTICESIHNTTISCKCFAYLTGTIFQYQHSITRILKKSCNPDVIFSPGTLSTDFLRSSFKEYLPVYTLGSSKYIHNKSSDYSQRKGILFLPEGVLSEAIEMGQFALMVSMLLPDASIYFRLHPIISQRKVSEHILKYTQKPDNFIFSLDDISLDADKSIMALYKGSTAIVEAMQSGCLPYRLLQQSNAYSPDPLWLVSDNISVIRCHQELVTTYEKNAANIIINKDFSSQYQAIELSKELLSEFQPNVFSQNT